METSEASLNEQQIAQLVRVFYERARSDADLRSIFENAVTDWDEHHRIIEDFWSRTLLGTNRYRGHPYGVHTRLPLRPEHFDRWLALFRQTAKEILPQSAAERAIERAEHMAESFKVGLFTFDQPVIPTHGKPAV